MADREPTAAEIRFDTPGCAKCGRGAEACEWCHNESREDWEAICDCGLHDFGRHLTDCKSRDEFRYVIAIDYATAELRRA